MTRDRKFPYSLPLLGNFGLRFDGKVKWVRISPSNSGRVQIGSLIARRYRLSFKGHRYLCLLPPCVCRTLTKAIGKSGKGSVEETNSMRYTRSHLVQNHGNRFAQIQNLSFIHSLTHSYTLSLFPPAPSVSLFLSLLHYFYLFLFIISILFYYFD